MIRLAPLTLLLILSCNKSDGRLPILGDDDTAGSEADADTDTDTDADTDTDTDTDTDGPEQNDCVDETDLIISTEVQDSSGAACSECESGDTLQFITRLKNPCNQEITMTTPTECIWAEYEIEQIGAASPMEDESNCTAVETAWEFADFETREFDVDSGVIEDGEYLMVLTINDSAGSVVTTKFTVGLK